MTKREQVAKLVAKKLQEKMNVDTQRVQQAIAQDKRLQNALLTIDNVTEVPELIMTVLGSIKFKNPQGIARVLRMIASQVEKQANVSQDDEGQV